MDTMIRVQQKVKFKNPVLIEGLPGIGNVGRVAAGYLISELNMKKFAELYSPHFLPLVILHDDAVAHLLKCEFYYCKIGARDLIVLTGDTQSISPEGHYEFCNKVLQFAKTLGVKEIITLGGFAEGRQVDDPRVIGAVSDKAVLKKYAKSGIDFDSDHQIGTIVGASGLLVGMSGLYNMQALCIMGETIGMPLMTDPKAADKILHVLTKILNLKLDLSKLEKTIIEMEERLKKADAIHKNLLEDVSKPGGKASDDIRYIG